MTSCINNFLIKNIYWVYNLIRPVFFSSKFERLFKKNMYNGCLSDSQRFCELFLCLATILITKILINNNNQVTPSLSKPHELSYSPNI